MSFSFEYSNFDSDGTVDQGTLSSSYTNALTAYLTGEGADHVAFLSHVVNGLEIDAALDLKSLIEAGDFTLTNLFSAAQSKTGAVNTVTITDPMPLLSATLADGSTIAIDLSAMLSDLDSETWITVTKVAKSTSTIYHTREFFSESTTPDGYVLDWAVSQNAAPSAEEIPVELDEYGEHATGADRSGTAQLSSVNLLDPAYVSDPDGDTLSVVADSVKIDNGDGTYSSLPSFISYSDGALSIDTNSAEFDSLYLDDSLDLKIVYQITDGINAPVDNSVALTITGSADQFSDSTTITVAKMSGDAYSETGAYELLGFDWSNVQVDVTGYGDYDKNNESFTVTLDVDSGYTGTSTSGNSENAFITVDPGQTLDAGWSSDGELDYTVSFTGPVDGFEVDNTDASTVGISLAYDYWL